MNTIIRTNRTAKRALAFLLCLITVFSVLAFADGAVFQTFAAAETEPVVISPTYTYNFDQKTYNSLLKQLNAQLKKKDFSKLTKTFLREILFCEVANYPQWKSVYPDLPSTAALIKDNLINVIPLIQKIKLIDRSTEEGRIFAEKVDYVGDTRPSSKGYIIRSLYTNPDKLDLSTDGLDEYLYNLQTLAHEIRHVRDMEGLSKQKFSSYFVDMVISDGATTFHERFVSPIRTFQGGSIEKIYTKKMAYIEFDTETNCSYAYYRCFYDALVYLAGYPTMNAVGKGKSLKTITQAISKRYGKETATSIWKILKALPDDTTDDHNDELWLTSNKAVTLSTQFFQILLQCIKKDIQNLDLSKPEALRKFMDIYRNVKLKVLPNIYNAKKKCVNEKYFNTKELDSLLAEKVIASKALPPLFDNPAFNRQAIIEMLYCDEFYYETTSDYVCHLPATIAMTEYTFTMDNGKPMVVEYFDDEYGWDVLFVCTMNEKGTVSRTCDSPNYH